MLQEHSLKKVTLILCSPLENITHPLLITQSDHQLEFHVPNDMPLSELFRAAAIPLSCIKDIDIKVGTLEEVMHTILQEEVL